MLPGLKKYGFFILLIVVTIVVYLDYKSSRSSFLTFAMLDVGQGDALFIESPTGVQVMFDGGLANKVLAPLGKVMGPLDREIDALVITNPDADHIGGFLDILRSYKVKAVFEPGTFNDSETYRAIKEEIKKQNIKNLVLKKGMRLNLGGGVVIDTLFPDREVIDWSANDGSLIAKLSYGDTAVMLTGDASALTEELVVKNNKKEFLESTVLKVGHHGSKTSTTQRFLGNVNPKYALMSLGKNNKYGHPHPDTLKTLNSQALEIFRTDLLGTIIMHSNGKDVTFSFKK